MNTLRLLSCLVVLGVCSGAAAQDGQGEAPRGLWQTEPDALGVVLHVRTRNCGPALCGRVERAKNRGGYDAPSGAVGEKVFWNLRPQPDGSFLGEYRGRGGDVYEKTRVWREGKTLRLEACNDETCKKLVWKRIR